MAFTQILIAAMALAARLEQSRQVRVIEKEVVRPVVVHVPAPAAESASHPSRDSNPSMPGVLSRPPAPPPLPPSMANQPIPENLPNPLPSAAPATSPTPLATPSVADPRAERLLSEARDARVAGDMGRAIVKLEEAQAAAPNSAAVLYEAGLVHEQMGVYDQASSFYQKVFELGVSGAGALYELAANKLREGFEQPDAMLGKLSLGRVRIFKDPNHAEGERVILSIPVQKAPAATIDVAELAVSVIFFNRSGKGGILQLEDPSWVKEQWVTQPFDWTADEETLRMTYTIPRQDAQTEHLFGSRSYYGQVVSLLYKGEVLDVQAWPRDLAARIPKAPAATPNSGGVADPAMPEFQDLPPPDADPEVPLLPPLPEK